MSHIEIPVTEARNGFADLVNKVAYTKERYSLMRKNKAMAVIVPIEDLEFLEKLEDHFDMKEVEKALLEMETEGTISWADLKQESGL
jgi:prevent-host-death family protein